MQNNTTPTNKRPALKGLNHKPLVKQEVTAKLHIEPAVEHHFYLHLRLFTLRERCCRWCLWMIWSELLSVVRTTQTWTDLCAAQIWICSLICQMLHVITYNIIEIITVYMVSNHTLGHRTLGVQTLLKYNTTYINFALKQSLINTYRVQCLH